MIKIIEITDRKSKILFDNEKYSGDRKVKLMVEKPEKKSFLKQLLKKLRKLFLKTKMK